MYRFNFKEGFFRGVVSSGTVWKCSILKGHFKCYLFLLDVTVFVWPFQHTAPRDTHDIATKPSPQLMVHRHGALSGFCPIIIVMKRLNAFVVGWSKGVGALWLSVDSQFWSFRCCTWPGLLASSSATVTLTNCLPSWVNMLLTGLGSPFLHQWFLHYCSCPCRRGVEELMRTGECLLGIKYGRQTPLLPV